MVRRVQLAAHHRVDEAPGGGVRGDQPLRASPPAANVTTRSSPPGASRSRSRGHALVHGLEVGERLPGGLGGCAQRDVLADGSRPDPRPSCDGRVKAASPMISGHSPGQYFGVGANLRPRERKELSMSLPMIVSRDEWLAARKDLLAKEKELTRAPATPSAPSAATCPWSRWNRTNLRGPRRPRAPVRPVRGARSQLILYHFMFDPWDEGCPSCSAGTDELSPGFLRHLHARDTSYAMVSRAPIEKLEGWKKAAAGTSPGSPPTAPASTTTSA